jgi:autotransporter-associated beta strand protein
MNPNETGSQMKHTKSPTETLMRWGAWTRALLAMSLTALVLTGAEGFGADLTWDSSGGLSGFQANGNGEWLDANQWWDGSANTAWVPGSNAVFGGQSTPGGVVTLASATSVGVLTFNAFTATYTLFSSGPVLTINNGIDKTATSTAVSIQLPVTLGGNQTWTNNSIGAITTTNGSNLVDNAGFQLTVGGTGNTTFGLINYPDAALTGSGALVKDGSSLLSLGGTNTSFTGNVTVNGGILRVYAPASINGNVNLANGVYEHYKSDAYTRTLGTGAGQIQITGGTSGFSEPHSKCNGAVPCSILPSSSCRPIRRNNCLR